MTAKTKNAFKMHMFQELTPGLPGLASQKEHWASLVPRLPLGVWDGPAESSVSPDISSLHLDLRRVAFNC